VWLHERKLRSAQQVAELADDHSLTRHSGEEAAPLKDAGSSPGSSRAKEVAKGPSQSRLPPKPLGELGRSQVNSRSEKQCFHCGKWGHIMLCCPNRKESRAKAESKTAIQACVLMRPGIPTATSTCDRGPWMAGGSRSSLTRDVIRLWCRPTRYDQKG